ncbi:MAG: hypothetical protein QNJ06_10580 [Kiloniellales bacterium]|nr:hypothetical protein [Kiloniellales bacterium]MDJ0970323.1 hypothetical protein [Kiloniellales bacterium]
MLHESEDLLQLRQFRRLEDGRYLFRACPLSRTFLLDPDSARRVSQGIRLHHWRLLQMLLPAVILIALLPILLKLDRLQPVLPLLLGYLGVSGFFWFRAEMDDYRRILRRAQPAPPELALSITWTELLAQRLTPDTARFGAIFCAIFSAFLAIITATGAVPRDAVWRMVALDGLLAVGFAALAVLFWKVWRIQAGYPYAGSWLRGFKDVSNRRPKAQGTTKQS